MAAPPTDLIPLLRDYHVLLPNQLDETINHLQPKFAEPRELAHALIRRGWLTPYQARRLFRGRAGELLFGTYVLLGRLGKGAVGRVLKARHLTTGEVVALKLLRPERLARRNALPRFRREARAAALLRHPNVVAARGAGLVGRIPYLVLEFVEGVNLAELVGQRGPLTARDACEYIRQAALGLQHAHEHGTVHRDIKPSNLLLSVAGVIKVLDLGLARFTSPAAEDPSLTRTGVVVGTADYIAPEQVSNPRNVDIRADLYAVGCTLYFLLTGRAPFQDFAPVAKLLKHQTGQPEPLERLRPDVPAAVVLVVRRLMAKRPENRFQTPAELAETLAHVLVWLRSHGEPECGISRSHSPAGVPAPSTSESTPSMLTEEIGLPTPDQAPIELPRSSK